MRRGVTLSAGARATLVEQTALARVPSSLTHATVQAAVSLAVGETAADTAISAEVPALLDGGLKTMFRAQLKKAAAWVLAVDCGGMFAYYALTAVLAFAVFGTVACASFAADDALQVPAPLIRSAGSGLWSEAGTWEAGKV